MHDLILRQNKNQVTGRRRGEGYRFGVNNPLLLSINTANSLARVRLPQQKSQATTRPTQKGVSVKVDGVTVSHPGNILDDKVMPPQFYCAVEFPCLPRLRVLPHIQREPEAVFLVDGNAGERQGQRSIDRFGNFISPIPYRSPPSHQGGYHNVTGNLWYARLHQ